MSFPHGLERLRATLIDARDDCDEAAKAVDEPAAAVFLLKMIDFHAGSAAEIGDLLRDLGVPTDDSGSLLSTVHRAAARLRAAVVGYAPSAFEPFINGGERIVVEYDAAVAESRQNPGVENVLDRQRTVLIENIAEATRLMTSGSES
jgi:uncharacterized protein (TIGR02284 family)